MTADEQRYLGEYRDAGRKLIERDDRISDIIHDSIQMGLESPEAQSWVQDDFEARFARAHRAALEGVVDALMDRIARLPQGR